MIELNSHGLKRGSKLTAFIKKAMELRDCIDQIESLLKEFGEKKKLTNSFMFWSNKMTELRNEADAYIKNAPSCYGPGYSLEDYQWDKQNIRDYWTKYTMDDFFSAKDSLVRVRLYERDHRMEPFEVIDNRIINAHIASQKKREELKKRSMNATRHTLRPDRVS